MTSQTITVRLPRELYQWLRRHAFDTGDSQNTVIVRSLSAHKAVSRCLDVVEYMDTVDGAGVALICGLDPGHDGLHYDSHTDISWKSGKP